MDEVKEVLMIRLKGQLRAVALSATIAVAAGGGVYQQAHAAGAKTFTIRVTGPHHLRFTGALDTMADDGSSDNHSVSGRATATYTTHGAMVAVDFQKEDDNGDQLKVVIYDGRRVVKSGSTRAAYGIVSLDTPLSL